ncbi:CpaF family protein [Enemella sp. A6]|uniref:CpaF family protein n=1 Tax=Enemella sp. A6 TaxID=3440152 RepID=UPI003EBC6D3F
MTEPTKLSEVPLLTAIPAELRAPEPVQQVVNIWPDDDIEDWTPPAARRSAAPPTTNVDSPDPGPSEPRPPEPQPPQPDPHVLEPQRLEPQRLEPQPLEPQRVPPQPAPPARGTPVTSASRADVSAWLGHRTSPTAAPAKGSIEWPLVVVLRRRAAELISAETEKLERRGTPVTEADRRLLGRSMISRVVHGHAEELQASGRELWDLGTEQAYAAAVEDAVFGYGRWQPLFEIPEAENIEITGWDSVQIQYGDGTRRAHPPVADSDEELIEAVRYLGESNRPSRPFDAAHPTITLALGDRFRLHAIGFGLSHRPSITIRQHTMTEVTLSDLVHGEMLPQPLADFLAAAVRARKSIVISGDQGAGKTTLLRALIAEIPHQERFGTLETDYELLTHLQPGRNNILALQARTGMGELHDGRRIGEVTVADLMPEALRQNLSRLIVGEVRGAEAGAMFEAAQSGSGLMATTHAHSASSTVDRLASRVAQAGVVTVAEAHHQIAHHLHLLVHVRLIDDTWRGGTRTRMVSEVQSLNGSVEGGRPVLHQVFRHEAGGRPVFQPDAAMAAELARYHRAADGRVTR